MQDKKNAIDHLRTHQKYPATKEELTKECDNLSDFSEADKAWFNEHLSNKVYASADQVIDELKLMEV